MRSNSLRIPLLQSMAVYSVVVLLLCGAPQADAKRLILHSSTALRDSGLFAYLLPEFTARYDIDVDVVAVGSGQALKNARRGLADLVITHDRSAEEVFIREGFAEDRVSFAVTRYIFVGSADDVGNVSTAANWQNAMRRMVASKSRFISRADESGTHAKERLLWQSLGINPATVMGSNRYLKVGAGMGQTLAIADQFNAYTLTDEATFLARKGVMRLTRLYVDSDPALENVYSALICLKPTSLNGHVLASQLVEWLVGEEAQQLIANFTIGNVQPYKAINSDIE